MCFCGLYGTWGGWDWLMWFPLNMSPFSFWSSSLSSSAQAMFFSRLLSCSQDRGLRSSSLSMGPFSKRSSAKQLLLRKSPLRSSSSLSDSGCIHWRARDRALPGKLWLKLLTSLSRMEASLSSNRLPGTMFLPWLLH